MRQVRQVASNPVAQVSIAGLAGYFLPKLFSAVMQSRASEPVAFTIAAVCATTMAWRLWNQPSSSVPVGIVGVHEAATLADDGKPDEVTADQKQAAQRIARWMKTKQVKVVFERRREYVKNFKEPSVSVDASSAVVGDTHNTSPVVAALVASGVVTDEERTEREGAETTVLEEQSQKERESLGVHRSPTAVS